MQFKTFCNTNTQHAMTAKMNENQITNEEHTSKKWFAVHREEGHFNSYEE